MMTRLTPSNHDAPTHRSIPAVSSGPAGRGDLLAGLSFLDDPPRTASALAAWLEIHLRRWGWDGLPLSVHEPAGGVAPLDAGEAIELGPLVLAARERVVRALLAFVGPERDDRFVTAAVAAGRVRRPSSPHPGLRADEPRCAPDPEARWAASPAPTDILSDVVLSLFAADLLNHRDFHEQELCVCSVCYAISFDPQWTGRRGCHEHPRAAVPGDG